MRTSTNFLTFPNRIWALLLIAVILPCMSAPAALIAFDGFEGVPGELGHSVTTTPGISGTMLETTTFPRTPSSRSLQTQSTEAVQVQLVTTNFTAVDLTNFVDVTAGIFFKVAFDSWESADRLKIYVVHNGTGGNIFLTDDDGNGAPNGFGNMEFEDNPSGPLLEQKGYLPYSANIPDDATTATLVIEFTWNTPSEVIWFDDVSFTGTQIPEPSSVAICGLVMLGFAIRRGRQSGR